MHEHFVEGIYSWLSGSKSPMTQQYQDDHLDELTVRQLFVFLKENIIFDSFENELIERNIFTDEVSVEYINTVPGKDYRIEKILKLFIKKNMCKEFIECMQKSDSYRHVYDRIQRFQTCEAIEALNVGESKTPPQFSVSGQLLENHFELLSYELEPRKIADEMFKAGHFSPSDHDSVTDLKNRNGRLKTLLMVLERKKLYAPFLDVLESLRHTVVLETLNTEGHFQHEVCNDALCIQHNFTTLQKELPGMDHVILMVESELDPSDISDIFGCYHATRQKSKLIKIVLRKGENTCKTFLEAILKEFNRKDLIREMKNKSGYIKQRGRPELSPNLRSLTTTCLKEYETFLYDELEPLHITDLLFEERAVTISAHDTITETICREHQTRHLLKTVMENNRDCLHFFLYVIQSKKEFQYISKKLENSANASVNDGTVQRTWSSLKHELVRKPGHVENEPLQVTLTFPGCEEIEQDLVQHISSCDADILEAAISRGHVDILEAKKGSVVLQLRPLTEDAVQTLLNAQDNNILFEMVFEMIKKSDIAKKIGYERPLQIRVQVFYAKSPGTHTNIDNLKATLIKKRVNIHKGAFLEELEPAAIVSALSKRNVYPKTALDRVCEPRSCYKQIQRLLAMVEEGSPNSVEGFMTVLNDLGYSKIVELITPSENIRGSEILYFRNNKDLTDPPDVHNEAENIRKSITFNYRNILDEMQTSFARETLPKCNGNVNEIREIIYEGSKSRRERMNSFLRFILHDDHNVVEFAKVLEKNGLKKLLSCKRMLQRKNISDQDIELTIVAESFPLSPDEVLFDSIITLSRDDDDTDAWTETTNFQSLSNLFDSFNIVIPEDQSKKSFTRSLLESSNLDKLVREIRYLAKRVVLCKHIKDEDKTPGTVYVYEVIVTYEENNVVIKEMNPREEIDFLHRKNDNLIKVILIKGGSANVKETKRKVHQEYKIFTSFQEIYLHHESEQYVKIAKLIADKKIQSYKQSVKAVRNSIPINHIENIVRDAVIRALSKESITQLCFEAVIEESGNINSDPYYCRSSSTVKRLKKELMEKTLQSVSDYLGSEICEEMQRHIVSDIKNKFDFDLDPFTKFLNITKLLLIQTILTGLAALVINPYVAVIVGVVTAVGTLFVAVNVNSRSWRRNVAAEIYEKVSKNRDELVKEVTSNIMERCKITKDQLNHIASQLDIFKYQLNLACPRFDIPGQVMEGYPGILDKKIVDEYREKFLTLSVPLTPEVPFINIVMIGETGSGKSSFLRTFTTALKNSTDILDIYRVCPQDSKMNSATKQIHLVNMNMGDEGLLLPCKFHDMPGIDKHGTIEKEDLDKILDGKIKLDVDSQTASDPAYEFHCILYVVSAETNLKKMPESLKIMTKIQKERNHEDGVRQFVVVTSIDKLKVPNDDMKNAYKYPLVRKYCNEVSEAFGVDLLHVIPVSNYFEEVTPNEAKNAMSLFNLWRVFISGKEYIERRWSKKETRFLKKDWTSTNA